MTHTMTLTCGNHILDLSSPKVMGVLNVTPDSFSDGGKFNSVDYALRHAEKLVAEGASIIDVGGESTRPGAKIISVQEELDRVAPIVEAIYKNIDTIISVDTSTPEVMHAAAQWGAGILNDVRALRRAGAVEMAAQLNLPVCLMHMLGEPQTMQQEPHYAGDVVSVIRDYLSERIQMCVAAGMNKLQLLIDPGFGFGKTLQHNLRLLNHLDEFKTLGVPILVGMSRKSIIGQVINKPFEERLHAGLALTTLAVLKGAHIIRVHDVAPTVDAIKMTYAVMEETI